MSGQVVIVGGGVIGVATAYYLASAGIAVAVTLIERSRVGGYASVASAGLLHPILSISAPYLLNYAL